MYMMMMMVMMDSGSMVWERLNLKGLNSRGAFIWDYSGYSSSGLGIIEYTGFQFPKERSFVLKTECSWRR